MLLWFCLTPREIQSSAYLPKVSGHRNQAWPMFCLALEYLLRSINLPKVCCLRSQAWPKFCLILKQIIRSINLFKVCGLRSQTWPMFCLILKQVIYTTYNILNRNLAKLHFINNNTFAGYLHSNDVVQHFCLNLLGNKHLYRLSRWYDMASPNWVPIFPMLGFLQYSQPSSALSL